MDNNGISGLLGSTKQFTFHIKDFDGRVKSASVLFYVKRKRERLEFLIWNKNKLCLFKSRDRDEHLHLQQHPREKRDRDEHLHLQQYPREKIDSWTSASALASFDIWSDTTTRTDINSVIDCCVFEGHLKWHTGGRETTTNCIQTAKEEKCSSSWDGYSSGIYSNSINHSLHRLGVPQIARCLIIKTKWWRERRISSPLMENLRMLSTQQVDKETWPVLTHSRPPRYLTLYNCTGPVFF